MLNQSHSSAVKYDGGNSSYIAAYGALSSPRVVVLHESIIV
jgi:hypothetical protein